MSDVDSLTAEPSINGINIDLAQKLFENGKASWFCSKTSPKTARKKWISSQLKSKGIIIVDDGAELALRKGASLLPAGIIEIKNRVVDLKSCIEKVKEHAQNIE